METTVTTTITAQGKDATEGVAVIHELSDGEKNRRAMKVAGIFLAVAVGSLFIPIVHFVAPPSCLILSVVAYVIVKKQRAVLRSASGPCPACAEVMNIPEQTLEWPMEWNCEACRKRAVIQPQVEAAQARAV